MSKILNMLSPVMALIPEVENPITKIVPFRSRAMWTIIVILIYLVACQIPLYGVVSNSSSDPFYWLRVILASNRGTIMELGISPIVTAGMVMQLIVGAKIIEIDQNVKSEKALFEGAQKLLGLIIGFCEAAAYVWSGMYGDIEKVGSGNAILIVLQLTFAGVIVLMLDDLLSKGHGLGNSAISLFIAINICETLLWKSFSPITYPSESGEQYEGAMINLFHSLIFMPNKLHALQNAFYRSGLPNISNLLSTAVIFLVVIYFQGFKVDISIKNNRVAGQIQSYPIKLFYTSNMPIILQTALVSNLYFFSQMLYKQFSGNFLVGLLGRWQQVEAGGNHFVPSGGLVYYLSPPRGLYETISDPLHTILYVAFVLTSCAIFSKTWIEVSGSSVRDVAKQLKEQGMSLIGSREVGLKKHLARYIPIAATFGGMCVGALTIVADFMGVIGSGTGILLAVNIVYGYFEQFKKEKEQGTLEF
ncbi:sec61 transport protein, putative [Ichthyophthirius multifiliis]|uniref:Sec61 transport protein, putative n=1 Tax=Ichthyophthirius multifiliis TaxID=5932 RepID=G0QTX0_ICHMU|nr:sec61 transport protein, putative [Ichthyophthirius multifiliis]EGR31329.1 sec61 transport protein, putative [Ichthyophthirius multifiliis]|eukprot:XP_004034815.1 sec61 transport protein, putative [Ichthyophthirius multifiliis]